jgi:hypothetical protein
MFSCGIVVVVGLEHDHGCFLGHRLHDLRLGLGLMSQVEEAKDEEEDNQDPKSRPKDYGKGALLLLQNAARGFIRTPVPFEAGQNS